MNENLKKEESKIEKDQKLQETKEQENNKSKNQPKAQKTETSNKVKRIKAKVALFSILILIIGFLGLQVYASNSGHGNVFFLIKDWVTGESVSDEETIFSDKDITLSYKSINLAEGLKVQVNRLQVENGKTTLYVSVKSEKGEQLPLKYEVKIANNESKQNSALITGMKPDQSNNYSYQDEIKLDYEIEENDVVMLDIKNAQGKQLRTLEINLQTREILVKGEMNSIKISKIELRKYLDIFSELNNGACKADTLLYIANKLETMHEDLMDKEEYEKAKKNYTDREFKNAIIKEVYGEKAEFEIKKSQNDQNVEVLKDMQGWKYDKEKDAYNALTAGEDYEHGFCLKIEDASYKNGIYLVKYIYTLATGYEQDDEQIEDLAQYEATIEFKRNDKNLYSKYQVLSITDGIEVKEKVNKKDVSDGFDNIFSDEDLDDVLDISDLTSKSTEMGEKRKERYQGYESKVNFAEFEDKANRLKIKYPDKFVQNTNLNDKDKIVEFSGNEYWTDGKNTEFKIIVYCPRVINIGTEEYKKVEDLITSGYGVGYELNTNGMWYQDAITKNHVITGEKSVNYMKIENGYVAFRVDTMFSNDFDGELEWIESTILSSYDCTGDFKAEKMVESTDTNNVKEQNQANANNNEEQSANQINTNNNTEVENLNQNNTNDNSDGQTIIQSNTNNSAQENSSNASNLDITNGQEKIKVYNGIFKSNYNITYANDIFNEYLCPGFVMPILINDKDFSQEEFSDNEIIRAVVEIDLRRNKEAKINYVDGAHILSVEYFNEITQKYFGRTINTDSLQKDENGNIILYNVEKANPFEGKLHGAYTLGNNETIYVFSYKDREKSETEEKVYGIKIKELSNVMGDFLYEGITDKIKNEEKAYNEYQEWLKYKELQTKYENNEGN